MIKISIVTLVLIYLAIVLALIGIAWLAALRRASRLHHRESLEKVACRACGHVFIDRSSSHFATCPHCGRPSEREPQANL
jgi:predicted Zn-ribbon and HTH transcriptional regulator